MLKRVALVAVAMAVFLGSTAPARAQAADFEMQVVFEDAVYGAAIGGLIGGGFMLLSKHPTDHWDYLTTGAGAGIILGAAYGVFTSTRSFAEYEDGKLRIAMPTPQLELRNDELAMQADVFRTRF